MAYGYGAEILRGAGQGAATGSSLGGTVGSVAGGVGLVPGAALGAGVGALAGGIRGAVQGRKNPQRNELEELLRRQEMDALGLTDEERRIMETQVVDPLATQFRQQQAMTPTQLSSGVAARMMMAQQEQQNRARAQAGQQIAMADTAERVREEEQIRKLEGSLYDQRKEDVKAAGAAAQDAASTVYSAVLTQAKEDYLKEYQNRILGMGEDAAEAADMVSDQNAVAELQGAARRAGITPDMGPEAHLQSPEAYMQFIEGRARESADMAAQQSLNENQFINRFGSEITAPGAPTPLRDTYTLQSENLREYADSPMFLGMLNSLGLDLKTVDEMPPAHQQFLMARLTDKPNPFITTDNFLSTISS